MVSTCSTSRAAWQKALNIMHEDRGRFHTTVSVLSEMGSLRTLARQDKHYTFYQGLPIYVESNRPRQYHQTIPFAVRGKDIRQADSHAALPPDRREEPARRQYLHAEPHREARVDEGVSE